MAVIAPAGWSKDGGIAARAETISPLLKFSAFTLLVRGFGGLLMVLEEEWTIQKSVGGKGDLIQAPGV